MNSPRVLACIAHHGTKNRQYLDRMIESFRSMSHPVTVVVLTDRERTDLPDDVIVRVGTPTSDPWSLPFGHRQVFIEHLDSHDLFLYSEDDTLIEQRHLDTFVDLQAIVPDDVITGFQRFERHPDGRRSYCSVHSHYHWDVASVVAHGGLTFARLTNDHGAAYALTRDQLERSIRSGGFDVEPHEGRYDMLVSAATDVYTRCGMQKLFCIERIEDQLVHHMPNVYLDRLGVDERTFGVQLDVLASIGAGKVRPDRLLVPEVALDTDAWDRHSFPRRNDALQTLLPVGAHRILAVGVTSGDIESVLVERGAEVVGVAADVVLGQVAAGRGVDVAVARLPEPEGVAALGGFDVLLLLDVLGYVEDPVDLLARLRPALLPGGEVIALVADSDRYRLRNLLRKRSGRVPLPTSWSDHGLRPTNGRWLRRCLTEAGFVHATLRHRWASRNDPVGRGGFRERILGNAVLGRARQPVSAPATHVEAVRPPRVTVGVPVYNGEEFLADALESILAQTFDDFEVVISDNASTDSTREICERYARRDPRVRYERQSVNRGAAANYNRTFELARGELFKWLAHDDWCEPMFLERCVAALDDAGPGAVLSYADSTVIGPDGEYLFADPDRLVPTQSTAGGRLIHTLMHLNMVNAVFGLMRSSALRQTRLIDAFVASDYVLLAELSMAGSFVRVDEQLLGRRIHPGASRQAANPTIADVQAWFDGGVRRNVVVPTSIRLPIEYVRSCWRAPLGWWTGLVCSAVVVPTVLARRARVLGGRLRRRIRGGVDES